MTNQKSGCLKDQGKVSMLVYKDLQEAKLLDGCLMLTQFLQLEGLA